MSASICECTPPDAGLAPHDRTLLHHDLLAQAAATPDREVLADEDGRCRYGELLARAQALADALRAGGIVPGDRVAIYLENGIAFVVAFYGTLLAGAVAMPVNPQTRVDKFAFMLGDAEAAALVTQASLAATWQPAVAQCASVRLTRVLDTAGVIAPAEAGAAADAARGRAIPDATIDRDLAAILYTSGSTGLPKGVMLSHLNMVSANRSVSGYLGLRADDAILCALPLTFDYGLYQVLMAVRVGARVVIERGFSFPVKALERMARERITVFPGVPTMFAMLRVLRNLARFDLGALRTITNTAAALPVEHIAGLRAMFPQARLFSMYGLTECKRVTYLPPEELDRRPGSVGRGMPNESLWLVDDAGRRLPHGSTGELVIRGSHVMLGYWRRPEETAAKLRDGPLPGERVLYSGDLFRTDDEGWLYFVGRRDDIIKSRGEKVSPREVEDVLHALAGVVEAAVVGVDDPVLGQAIRAYVHRAAGAALDERTVIRHCLERLEPFMVPRQVVFTGAFPRSANGKVDKRALTEAAGAAGGRSPFPPPSDSGPLS
jgi:amino acid adenylation domain-containing protein